MFQLFVQMCREFFSPISLFVGGICMESKINHSLIVGNTSVVPVSQKTDEIVSKTMPKKNLIPVHIRWMIRRDMPEVLDIETQNFEFPWSDDEFIRCLRQRNCIGFVAEFDERVVGFLIYELHWKRLHILNFAVQKEFHRCGIGSQIINKLASKLTPKRRKRILLEVTERNLHAQLFFQAMGFRAVSVIKDFYQDTSEDAYLMQFCIPPQPEYQAVNRATRLSG